MIKFEAFIRKIIYFFTLFFFYILLVGFHYDEYFADLKQHEFMSDFSYFYAPDSDPVKIAAKLGVTDLDLANLDKTDKRVALLKIVFRKYDSDLYDLSEFIVKTSDTVGLDYRIIPSIAMHESGGCKHIPVNSYNCWGYGIYGNKVTRFANYEEAITTVAKGLKKNYIDKGLTTPETIMRKYTPPSDGSWAKAVTFFLGKF